MFKLGAITVGQSPRTDVTDDIMGIFQGKFEILERGASAAVSDSLALVSLSLAAAFASSAASLAA